MRISLLSLCVWIGILVGTGDFYHWHRGFEFLNPFLLAMSVATLVFTPIVNLAGLEIAAFAIVATQYTCLRAWTTR